MAYNFLIHGVCKKPNSDLVCDLLNEIEMKEFGWIPLEGTFTSVSGACVKQENIAEALKVKYVMVGSGVLIKLVVATSLMKGYCLSAI